MNYLFLIPKWLNWADKHWTDIDREQGYYGCLKQHNLFHSGNLGYMAACALLVSDGEDLIEECNIEREELIRRALAAFRFTFKSHEKWGREWSSPTPIERAANFIPLIEPYMSEEDILLWRKIMELEADYHCAQEIETNRYGAKGETHAERNYWRGSLQFRMARMFPDHKNASRWLESASQYCTNAVSVPDDEFCETVIDGKKCMERFLGANVHPDFVFDHHGAVSIAYCVHVQAFFTICMMGLLRNDWKPLDSLFHHIADLWSFARKAILPNGRIAHLGGEQRPRYSIAQNYLLPVCLFWQKYGQDQQAGQMANGVYNIIENHAKACGDGSFYSVWAEDIDQLSGRSYYSYRLETDVIFSLGLAHILEKLPAKKLKPGSTYGIHKFDDNQIQETVVSGDTGLLLKRSSHGLFSVYWDRPDTAEADPPVALVAPFSNPHRIDWLSNLSTIFKPFRPAHPRHISNKKTTLCGESFVASAHIHNGLFLRSDDQSGYAFDQKLAFILLPDGKTFLRIEKVQAHCDVTATEIASFNLNLVNDYLTGNELTLITEQGTQIIKGVGGEKGLRQIQSSWLQVADELGIVSLYGPPEFQLETFSERQRAYKTLLVERLYYPLIQERKLYQKGEMIIDTAVMLICNSKSDETKKIVQNLNFHKEKIQPDKEEITFTTPEKKSLSISIHLEPWEVKIH